MNKISVDSTLMAASNASSFSIPAVAVFLLIASALSSVGIAFLTVDTAYRNIFYLPLALSASILLLSLAFNRLKKHPLFIIIVFQLLIRYLLVPILFTVGPANIENLSLLNLDDAIILMLYELAAITVTLIVITNLLKATPPKALGNLKVQFFNTNGVFIAIVLVISVALFSQINQLKNVSFIWDLSAVIDEYKKADANDVGGNNLAFMLFRYRILIVLMGIGIVYKTKMSDSRKCVLSIGLIFMNSLFIIGTSRFSILYQVAPFIFLITHLYPRFQKNITYFSVAFLIFILLIVSLVKFSTSTQEYLLADLFDIHSLNAYFSGIGNMSTGLAMYKELSTTDRLLYFVNDFFQNIPGLASATVDTYKSNVLFNLAIYGSKEYQDQIVPIGISGLMHYGYLFMAVYSTIFIMLSFYFYTLAMSARTIAAKFVYLLIAFNCSLIMMLNFSSLTSNVVSHLLFTLIPFLALDKITRIKRS